jgi:hypothetical protein
MLMLAALRAEPHKSISQLKTFIQCNVCTSSGTSGRAPAVGMPVEAVHHLAEAAPVRGDRGRRGLRERARPRGDLTTVPGAEAYAEQLGASRAALPCAFHMRMAYGRGGRRIGA